MTTTSGIDGFFTAEIRLRDVAIARYWLEGQQAHADSIDLLAERIIDSRDIAILHGRVAPQIEIAEIKSKYSRLFKEPELELAPSEVEPQSEEVQTERRKTFGETYPDLINQKTGLPRNFEDLANYSRHGTISPGSKQRRA